MKIWWAFVWRTFVFALLAGTVIGLLFGLVSPVIRLTADQIAPLAGVFALAIGVLISVEVMYRLLGKKFKNFEIAVLTETGK